MHSLWGGNNILYSLSKVKILGQSSRCHADTLKLEIVSNTPYETANADVSQNSHVMKSDLVKEVTKSAEEAQLAQERARAEIIQEEYQEYCQTKGTSLYQLLEEIRDLDLLDVTEHEV